MRPLRVVSMITTVVLAGIGALHVLWARGSTFPFPSEEQLADSVAGTAEFPSSSQSYAVAGLLTTAAALVAGVPPSKQRWRRLGVMGVATVLGVRGLAGVTGRTRLLVAWTPSDHFVAIDRRFYGPLCLALSAGASVSLSR